MTSSSLKHKARTALVDAARRQWERRIADDAEEWSRESVRSLTHQYGADHDKTLLARQQHALALWARGRLTEAEGQLDRPAEAEAELRAVLPVLVHRYGAESVLIPFCRAWHGVTLHDLGRLGEASAELPAAVAELTRVYGPEHARVLRLRGRPRRAQARSRSGRGSHCGMRRSGTFIGQHSW